MERCTVDGFVIIAELRPSWRPTAALLAEPGRVAQNSDVVAAEVTLALFDVPDVLEQFASQPMLLLAASTPAPAWKACCVEIDVGHQRLSVRSPSRKTVLGRALTTLAPGEPYLVDTDGSVEVELIDPNQWLVSCDDEALANGGNLAVLGSELIQFCDAAPISAGRFRLGRLLRGRGGTEWAAGSHVAGDIFALIERDALRPNSNTFVGVRIVGHGLNCKWRDTVLPQCSDCRQRRILASAVAHPPPRNGGGRRRPDPELDETEPTGMAVDR